MGKAKDKPKKIRVPSVLEATLAAHIRFNRLPMPHEEYRFDPTRRWKFDFAWPAKKIAAECEGGTRKGGRHTRHDGYTKDCEKYNAAAMQGWKVYRFTSSQINDLSALETLRSVLCVGDL